MSIPFRIYYGDGTTFEGRPEDAPTRNVQAVVYEDEDKGLGDCGRVILESWDIYIYSDPIGGWHGTNKYVDLLMHLERGCGPGGVRAVILGLWIPREEYKQIIHRAKTDPGFPPKSAVKPPYEDGEE